MKRKILYIHGFMSSSNTLTVKKLEKRYGVNFDFIVPELNVDIDSSLGIINDIITNENPVMIIGSSLGGFYALVCNSYDIPILVINPCVNPCDHLKKYLGKTLTYHSERKDGSETYVITKTEIDKFKKYDIESAIKEKGKNISAILSINDEVLGDTHLKLFERIRKEATDNNKPFICKTKFGHREYPYGIVTINDFIYEKLIST